MSNIITKQLKINNSKNFIDSVSLTSGNSLYMFLGKPNPWQGDDNSPPLPKDNQQNITNIWDEMVSLKRIYPNDIINVVKRIDWSYDSVYAEYDSMDENLFDKSFYVLNSEFNVYKCISNNNGNLSKFEPTGKNRDIITLADNYRWKFLYNITIGNQLKFLTKNWMPVLVDKDISVNAKGGSIEHIKILNGGLDYSTTSTIIINGDGEDASIRPKLSLGVLYDFSYTNIGKNYRFATASLYDPTGSGNYANIKPIVSPINGHGYDPISELGSNFLMINVKTEYNEGFGDFPGKFSFRKIGILKNPIDTQNNVANSSTLAALSGIYLTSAVGTFLQNEFIEGTTSLANAYVVTSNVTLGNGYIKFIRNFDLTSNYEKFVPNEIVLGKTSGATARVSNLLYSEITPNKGEIYYVENRTPVIRSVNQTDNLHLVIEF
jgi:hypothetical protein